MSLVQYEPTGSSFSLSARSQFCSRFQVQLNRLHHTRSGRVAYSFNAIIVHGLTLSLLPLIARFRHGHTCLLKRLLVCAYRQHRERCPVIICLKNGYPRTCE